MKMNKSKLYSINYNAIRHAMIDNNIYEMKLLAEKIPIDNSYLCKCFKGMRNLTEDNILRIAKILNLELDKIIIIKNKDDLGEE